MRITKAKKATHSMFVSTSTIARSMSGFSSKSSVSFGVKSLHGSHLKRQCELTSILALIIRSNLVLRINDNTNHSA